MRNKFMEKLNCTIELKLGESAKEAQEIFDKVFNEIENINKR